MAFNFGSLANVKPASTTSYLKAYTINENVTIKSSEITSGTSATTGKPWKCLKITFGNDEGIFTDSIFFIDDSDGSKDFDRKSYDMPNGGKRETPSAWENFEAKISAIGFAFFPDNFKKLQANANKFKNFEELMNYFKKMVDAAAGKTTTSMKLVGRNTNGRVFAALPNCLGIAQAKDQKRASENGVEIGQWYTWLQSPFGDKLSFSAYEMQQKNAIDNATPTDMSAVTEDESFDSSDLLDLDL